MPADLQEHFRYPEDLFRVQTTMWAQVPRRRTRRASTTGNDFWDVAQDPGAATLGQRRRHAGTTASSADANVQPSSDRIDPYYLLTRSAGRATASRSSCSGRSCPTSSNDGPQLLTAFMVAKSDPDDYGRLESFVMPPTTSPTGRASSAAQMQIRLEVVVAADPAVPEGLDLQLRNLRWSFPSSSRCCTSGRCSSRPRRPRSPSCARSWCRIRTARTRPRSRSTTR